MCDCQPGHRCGYHSRYNRPVHPVDQIVNDAEHGDPSTITCNGEPVAVVMGWDDYRRLTAKVGAFS